MVGGGLAECGEVLLAPLRTALRERLTFQRRPEIVKAALGERAGLLGAVWQDKTERNLADLESGLAFIGGTSNCLMAVSREAGAIDVARPD